jgi:actin-related protein
VPEPVLIAISAHRPTCMIIQIGEDTTTVSIVWENELLPQSVVVIERGDADVTRYVYIHVDNVHTRNMCLHAYVHFTTVYDPLQ